MYAWIVVNISRSTPKASRKIFTSGARHWIDEEAFETMPVLRRELFVVDAADPGEVQRVRGRRARRTRFAPAARCCSRSARPCVRFVESMTVSTPSDFQSGIAPFSTRRGSGSRARRRRASRSGR